jgi:hypothetical protein
VRTAALALAALALGGCLSACESSQEEVAKREAALAAKRRPRASRGLSIEHPSTVVKVLAASVLHDPEGAAAVVTVHNTSATALREVPIEIDVKDAAGATVYTNTMPGLALELVSLPLLRAHATSTWVDDQVQSSTAPASVTAEAGEGERDGEAIPTLAVAGVSLNEGEAEGSLVNRSHTSESEVAVYAVARRGGAIVAAGSSIVALTEAGTSTHFQAPLIGNANGAQLEVSVAGAA